MKRTTIHIDEKLMKKALKATGINTQKEVVNFALKEIVRKQSTKKILELKGKVEWKGQ
ncbi:MAG: type II toxin-antitoxin system VapB family antitoxin [Candidatus Dadabacteria bacterium]|nr:type II toxin-antitoxin system VapB family antitoxin [Candidatus Dadabacteria bacterium]